MEKQIALIGFGEAGSTFASAAGWGSAASAYDINPSRADAMKQAGVTQASDAANGLAEAQVVLSLVTADQALKAAQQYAGELASGALWLDMNSVAPETKRAAAAVIEGRGGHYVDVAILAPVNPAKMQVPLLLAGPHAEAAQAQLEQLGFTNLRNVGAEVGRASAIKMIRSVMVKGVEALTDEMMAGAHAAGVAEEVLASLDASEKAVSWTVKAPYNLERMTTHGERRAAEMEEAAATLHALGVEPIMTQGTVQRQREAALPKLSTKDAA